MAEFEERKKFWRIFYSPLVFMVLLVVFLFMARAAWRVYGHVSVSSADRQRTEEELAKVNQREEVLKKNVEVLQTPQGVEDEIRAKFNVSKQGEGVAVIVDNHATSTATATPAKSRSWWQKLFGF